MGKLVLFRPDGTAQDLKLDRERVTIGRRPDNDVCLAQAAVSGEHAAVVTILDDSFLEDLGSTNGTLVNGKAVTKHFLQDRDEIDIGREILVYVADDSAKIDAPRAGPERTAEAEAADGAGLPPREPAERPRDKRRSDVPAISGQSVDAIQRERRRRDREQRARATAARTAAVGAGPCPRIRHRTHPPHRRRRRRTAIRVRSGTAAGRVVALTDGETVIGRAGVQVVALRRLRRRASSSSRSKGRFRRRSTGCRFLRMDSGLPSGIFWRSPVRRSTSSVRLMRSPELPRAGVSQRDARSSLDGARRWSREVGRRRGAAEPSTPAAVGKLTSRVSRIWPGASHLLCLQQEVGFKTPI